MTSYLIVKWLHIMSSVLMVGTGFGSAFYLYFTHRSGNAAAFATVSRLVVRADWWFTTPTVIFQPLSGLWLASVAGWEWSEGWLLTSTILFAFAGLCWLPVVWLQIRMADIAARAETTTTPIPPTYWRYARYWEWLGYPAFVAMVVVYFMMVVKPPF